MNKYSSATETIKEHVTFREAAERYGGVYGLSLKTRTFDFHPHGNDEIDFTDKDGDE